MLYHIAQHLQQQFSAFNVVHYVTFRAMAALLTSIFYSFLFGNWFINKSKIFFRSKSRELTPQSHRAKDDMPTMGGVFILSNVLFSSLLWANWSKHVVWIFLLCLVGFGVIGFWDDWNKIRRERGISARTKSLLQLVFAGIVVWLWLYFVQPATSLSIPFFKHLNPDLGFWLFLLWAVFIIIGCCNAVNLTDGLDGLAIGSLISNFATFSLICYLAGHHALAHYLHIPFADSAEISVIGAMLVGASLGFLWYNAYPAQIFMGDVGALSLGSALALMALMAKQELLLPLAGGLFVLEAVSVMAQVFSFKYRGKRILKMAPLHHHYELEGMQESKITVRFGIVTLILCIITLMTLKMR